ncbi:BRO1 domain-containing protein BROX [Lamprotornis superbus]|uniref:BRO1 domain-containing protein BROX n=1 Tax=Lamprotornis superbus TaxID=245042 RepID=A0A835NS65_9PASS|nr:BRO1 domain-containing protein BROX [Lamprotornis superbus]
MTHWFHRNPLKATAPVSFNYYGVATTPAATKVCNDLRLSRTRLLELFTDSSCNPEMMKNAADLYFSLLQGFILSLGDSSQECKLRYIQNFKWTDTLQGQVPSAQQDAVFELVSMGFNVALWYTKYASRLAGKEDHIPKLITPVEKGRDLEARLIDSYIIQCQAEAQEVTIARAIELKHNPGLIAALAYETANFYQKADQTLSSLDPAYAGKWRKYLNLKSCFYMAYAYCYHGQTLLASDKCGEAIRSLQESEKFFAKAEALCKEYGETKGPGTTAKPSGHLFFRKLGSLIKNTLEKCQRENGFMAWHFPALNAHWTPETVAAFDLTKRPKEDTAKPKPDEEVKPLKEPDIKPQKDMYFSGGPLQHK